MAATRLIAMHVQKNRSLQQCIKDRTDYAENGEKTEEGKFISAYECDPETVDREFAVLKNEYARITGRPQHDNDIIAYQIRQSFKPGEITPEEANKIGYETAMRWTKGNHAFIVATHVDKNHIHNQSGSLVYLRQLAFASGIYHVESKFYLSYYDILRFYLLLHPWIC